jgi:hypothetical protein
VRRAGSDRLGHPVPGCHCQSGQPFAVGRRRGLVGAFAQR